MALAVEEGMLGNIANRVMSGRDRTATEQL